MKTTRLLLPFTHGVEMQALEVALRFAHSYDAILMPLALIRVNADTRTARVRPELLQQAQDFLESVKYKASEHNVKVEFFEATTPNIVEKIAAFADMKECEGILLFARNGKGLLLQTHEIQAMLGLEAVPARYLIHLPVQRQTSRSQRLVQRLLGWLDRGQPLADAASDVANKDEEVAEPVLKLEHVNGYNGYIERICLF